MLASLLFSTCSASQVSNLSPGSLTDLRVKPRLQLRIDSNLHLFFSLLCSCPGSDSLVICFHYCPWYLLYLTTFCHSSSVTQYHSPGTDILSFVLRPEDIISKKESNNTASLYVYAFKFLLRIFSRTALSIPLHSCSLISWPSSMLGSFSFLPYIVSFPFSLFETLNPCKYEI